MDIKAIGCVTALCYLAAFLCLSPSNADSRAAGASHKYVSVASARH